MGASATLHEPPRLPWPTERRLVPVLLTVILVMWWDAGVRALAGAHLPTSRALALFVVAWRVGGFAVESAWYVAWWRAWGTRVPFLRLAMRIALLSLLDLMATALLGVAHRHPALAPGCAVLAGHAAFGAVADGPLALAFQHTGLLTALRLAGTADAQARALRGGRATPLALTLALTLGTWGLERLVLGFALALARGPVGLPS